MNVIKGIVLLEDKLFNNPERVFFNTILAVNTKETSIKLLS